MRSAQVLAAALLAAGLTACSDSGAEDLNGDGTPSVGPTSTVPSVDPFPVLPPGEEFDPEHYDPEGDRAPTAEASPGFPGG